MVLLAAAVCTKGGKALLSRQFVEMTKARIEGLLAAFPKLMSSGRQHTFVETESVRYVYQPLDLLYMLLITTKASNILEDLETLRLFSRVVPEYCRSLDEADITDNAFNLIFAFDEIVALGYRESVNLAQIRTFVEMDSHEEKVYRAVRETQEREAKTRMKEKAKELQRKRYEEMKRGGGKSSGYGGYGSNSGGNSGGFQSSQPIAETITSHAPQEARASTVKSSVGGGKAMKLGSRAKDVDSFVDALKSEGERISTAAVDDKISAIPQENAVHNEPIHVLVCEDLVVHAGRDGGLRNLEVQGILKLRISSAEHGLIRLQVYNQEERAIQLQTHPNVDRELWKSCSQVGMKQANKPFPINTDVGVVKWRFQTSDDAHIPLTINCWPQEDGNGNCDVNIEYTLEDRSLELNNVTITIPLCTGAPPPSVHNCDGSHEYDRSHNALVWSIALLDASAPSGTLDLTARGSPDTFFPVKVAFSSTKSYCNLKVGGVVNLADGAPVNYSCETILRTTNYQID
uniref:Coatomer subunit delta n=1 Tax=Hirondellea gigas TaxID=1518452 RepID=A0A6A7FSG6_9CRUS